MFVFKHACLNLKRHTWNYLLVGIILFLLILGVMVTNTIYTSAKIVTENYSKHFTTLVTILEPDLSNLAHEKKLTKEQYLKFGESKYVKETRMIASVPVSFDGLKTIEAVSIPVPIQQLEGNVIEKSDHRPTATWFGAGADDLVKELSDNGMKLITGSANLKINECLISDKLARLNQLKIGDSIQVTVIRNNQVDKQALVIAGMYQSSKNSQSNGIDHVNMIQENDVFTNWETVHGMNNFNLLGYNSVSYELKNMEDFDEFFKEMQANGLPNEYHVITNEANMKMILSPVNGVITLAGTILLGLLIFGNFGLALFSIRKFKQKQTELCVLRNIGITQKQLINSQLIELVVVIIIIFSLAFLTTRWIVQPIADWQLNNQKMLMGNVDQLFMGNGKTEVITSIPMTIGYSSFMIMLGITCLFLITIISIESYKIFKFEPIEFLLERNTDEE